MKRHYLSPQLFKETSLTTKTKNDLNNEILSVTLQSSKKIMSKVTFYFFLSPFYTFNPCLSSFEY